MAEDLNKQLTLFDVEEFTQESIKIQQQPHRKTEKLKLYLTIF